jgi:hypothetical protein
MLDDVPADLADGDDDTLGALGCAADELAVATSGGGWICTSLDRLRVCPADMVAVGDSCVEINERGTDTMVSAMRACDAVGRRLCRVDELYVSCALSLTADATDDQEMTANVGIAGQYLWVNDVACNLGRTLVSSYGAYRCCMNP